MAEVFGVIGSAVGVLSFGLRAAKGLISYYESYKDSRKDVARLFSSLQSLAVTLETLKDPLFKTNFSEEQVENISSKIEDCEESMMEFTEVLTKVTESEIPEIVGGRSIGLRDKWKHAKCRLVYPFRESTILKLQEAVNYVSGNLGLAMQSMQLSTIPIIQEKLDHISQGVNDLVGGQEDEKTKSVLQWMSTIDCKSKQEETLRKREKGTGMWLLGTQEFRNWFDGKNKVLWGWGGRVGKTILASAVIHETQHRAQGNNVAVAFLYCNYAERGAQKLEVLLGSIAQQLFSEYQKLPQGVLDGYHRYTSTNLRQTKLSLILNMIKIALATLQHAYIIVDALDECDSNTRVHLLESLQEIGPHIHLFLTSRHMGEELDGHFMQAPVRMKIRGSDEDIQTYLKAQINTQSNLVRLCGQHQGLSERIIQGITKKADGMFLLAHFHIEALAAELRVKHLLKTLASLPGSLRVTYQDAMTRIFEGQDKRRTAIAMHVLLWATFSTRPLDIPEMQHALSAMELDEDENIIDTDDLYHKDVLVTSCAGLIVIDESNFVRLVHYSVQQYLMDERDTLFPNGRNEVLKACMKYLSMDSFIGYEPGNVMGNFEKEEAHYNDLAKQFPLLNYSCRSWGEMVTSRDLAQPLVEEILDFVYNKYSRGFTLVICDRLFFGGGKLFETFTQSRQKEKIFRVENCFSINPLGKFAALLKAAIFNFPVLTRMLLEDGEKVERHLDNNVTALHLAAFTGHGQVLKELLRSHARVDAVCNTNWGDHWSALHLASSQGFPDIAETLLRAGADVNIEDSEGRTPLIIAARWSYASTFIGEVKQYNLLFALFAMEDHRTNFNAIDSQDRDAKFWPTPLEYRWQRSHSTKASQIAGYPLYIDLFIDEILRTINEHVILLPQEDDEILSCLLAFREEAEYPAIPRLQKYPSQARYRDILLWVPSTYESAFPQAIKVAIGRAWVNNYIIILKDDGSSLLILDRTPNAGVFSSNLTTTAIDTDTDTASEGQALGSRDAAEEEPKGPDLSTPCTSELICTT